MNGVPQKRCLLCLGLEGRANGVGARLSRGGAYRYTVGSAVALTRVILAVLNIASDAVIVVTAGIAAFIFIHKSISLPLWAVKNSVVLAMPYYYIPI